MPRRPPSPPPEMPKRLYSGTEVTLRVIRRYVRQIAARFEPDRILLFGSHAYGTLHADSDVDLLVIMPTRNPVGQAVRIRLALPAPFPLDLLVRSPEKVARALEIGDSFLTEVMAKGKVLHEKGNRAVGSQGRGRLSGR